MKFLAALLLVSGIALANEYTIPVPADYNHTGAWVNVSDSAENRTFILNGSNDAAVLIEMEIVNGYVPVARLNGPSARKNYQFTGSQVRARRIGGTGIVSVTMSADAGAVIATSGLVGNVYMVAGPEIDVSTITREMTISYNGCNACSILVEGKIANEWGNLKRLEGTSFVHTSGGYSALRAKRLSGVYSVDERLTVSGLGPVGSGPCNIAGVCTVGLTAADFTATTGGFYVGNVVVDAYGIAGYVDNNNGFALYDELAGAYLNLDTNGGGGAWDIQLNSGGAKAPKIISTAANNTPAFCLDSNNDGVCEGTLRPDSDGIEAYSAVNNSTFIVGSYTEANYVSLDVSSANSAAIYTGVGDLTMGVVWNLNRVFEAYAFRHIDSGPAPACDGSTRGMTFFTQANPGTKDKFEVCAKDAGDVYTWRVLY